MAYFYDDGILSGDETETQRPSGSTNTEARRVRDEGLVKVLGPRGAAMVTQGAATDMPVAAASKAIIQRDVRNAAVIYDGLYSHQNPFEKITDEELEMYRREIELKSHPELAVELERRGMLVPGDTPAQSPPVGDSLAVDSGATDLESVSEAGPGKYHAGLDPSILSSHARTSPTAELVQGRGSHTSHSPLEQSSPGKAKEKKETIQVAFILVTFKGQNKGEMIYLCAPLNPFTPNR
ncbi:hypothetical protein FGIG_11377 [Fasciola gigantica]|uniref:Uncharacterized protein n=1 Tax=Fasciola gigantica TaxID=46835 RepID=A0A504YLY6_FASGI|nr:hypothetical protein FGIG_11377 [Fasciola gigantica]